MAQILVFGDSVTYGAWDDEGGWVQRLKRVLDERSMAADGFYCLVYNLGIDGDTTTGLLDRFEFETKQRFQEKETIFIFNIGANDSLLIKNLNNSLVPAEKFEENIGKIIAAAKKFSQKIIFIGLAPLDETKVDPVPWVLSMSYKNEIIEKYNEIVKLICQKENVGFVDIAGKFKSLDYKNFLKDGVHPNSEGHRIIFETVNQYLTDNKVI